MSKQPYLPMADLLNEYGLYKDAVLSRSGSLLDGFRLSGLEPDSLSEEALEQLTLTLSHVYSLMPDNLYQTQYYIKTLGHQVSFRDREDPIVATLVNRRAAYLNQKPLANTHLFHLFEAVKPAALKLLNKGDLLRHAMMSPVSSVSRNYVRQHLSARGHFALSMSATDDAYQSLQQVMQEVGSHYDSLLMADPLGVDGVGRLLAFLLTLDVSYLQENTPLSLPLTDWDQALAPADIDFVSFNRADYIRISGDVTRYARLISGSKFMSDQITPGLFISEELNPLVTSGNFILMSRFKPMSQYGQSSFFRQRTNELERQNISLRGMLRGNDLLDDKDRVAVMRGSLKGQFEQLDAAQDLDVRWGTVNLSALAFDTDLARLDQTVRELNSAFHRIGVGTVYERAGLPKAYQSIYPAGSSQHFRDLPFNTTQYAASSLLYKSATGLPIITDYNNEESLYVFESKDGTVFHYSPFINGRGLVINIGPIRSGKSFLRATLATHFGKYGGLIRLLDIDPGGEPVAQCYGEDGAIFRVDVSKDKGFNLFASYREDVDNESLFLSHLSRSITNLLSLNESSSMQVFAPQEQLEIDRAIKATLSLPVAMRSLSNVAAHCSKDVQAKMARFVGEGLYGHIFDSPIDAIGAVDTKVAAFNLAALKDNPDVLPLVMNEIFFRIISAFEDPSLRTVPKYADFDEAHIFLKIPGVADMIASRIRTWGKWLGGMSLTTQSPRELIDIPDWPVLRSAASTLIFMADPTLDPDLYKEAFQLTDAEIHQIAHLKPRKEAYIIQREIGVSKIILVDVEPEQYVINTSRPDESTLRARNIEQFGFDAGIQKTVEALE